MADDKKSLIDTFIDGFFEVSWEDWGRHIVTYLAKSCANFVTDFVTDAVRYKFYGGKTPPSISSFNNKSNYTNPGSITTQNDIRNLPAHKAYFNDRQDAKKVLDEVTGTLKEYGRISVAEFCRYAGKPYNYAMNNYGWESISANAIKGIDPEYPFKLCHIMEAFGGWVLELPSPIIIKAED